MVLAILSLLVMGFVTHRPLLSRLAEQRQVRGYIVTVAVVLPNLLGLWMLYEDCLCRANPHLWSRVPFHALWHLLGTWTTYVLFQMLALFTAPRIGAAPFIAVPDDATPSLWKCFLYWIACFVVYRRL
ncbi:hypothetical protein R1flu_024179 [Riccia fluitans]|uniref:Alkaline ceramidase n=1 Tax=Riccia fluitans TaxID=41844 RepID=A0ABD1XU53_9MARC